MVEFRAEAIQALTRPMPAVGTLSRPPGWRLYLLLTGTFMLLSVIALATVDLPRTALATGWLTPGQGLVQLHAGSSGFVTHLYARQGDLVSRHQPLMRISADVDGAIGSVGALRKQLDAESRTLTTRLRGVAELQTSQTSTHALLLQQAQGDLASLRRSLTLEQAQLTLAQRRLAAVDAAFGGGAIAGMERDQVRAAVLRGQQAVETLQSRIMAAQARLTQLPREQLRDFHDLDATRWSLAQQLSALEQRRLQLDIARTEVVKAPVSGRLVTLDVHVGEQVTPHTRQAAILPADSPLVAELRVPSHALGYVEPHDSVRLRFESFPHQKFGSWPATIRSVSKVLSMDAGPGTTAAAPFPAFKVIADLSTDHVHLHGNRWQLQPDMRLSAILVLERRKAWEWLFEPLLDVLNR